MSGGQTLVLDSVVVDHGKFRDDLYYRLNVLLVDPDAVPVSLDGRLHDFERHLILRALRATGGNKSRAAHLLKVKRSTLGDRIKRCELDESWAAGEPWASRASA